MLYSNGMFSTEMLRGLFLGMFSGGSNEFEFYKQFGKNICVKDIFWPR